jgi:hypothetical protein
MNLKGYRIRFAKDRSAVSEIRGVDMQAKMPIVAQFGKYIVFKRDGFTGWTSVGETGYYPPVYYLVRVDEEERIITEALDDIEVSRSTWRGVRDALIEKAKSLARAE